MSSTIEDITCPDCGGTARRETDHKTGEIHEWCGDCEYEEIVNQGEKEDEEEVVIKYKIVDNIDGNIEVELESNTREEAIEEALGALGWNLVAYDEYE